MIRLLALGLGVAALTFGFMPASSSASVSDAEASALVGGGCTHKLQDTKCQDLTMTVVNDDGTVEEVACPSWPETFRLHVKDDKKGTHKAPTSFIATCNGCGKFYKKEVCDPTVDPTDPPDPTDPTLP